MPTRRKSDLEEDKKFWLFCLAVLMAGYLLLFQDRFVPYNAVWNNYLWLLLGPFVFGLFYRFEFFAVSFWLMLILGFVDILKGINLNVTGPSCWSGFEVWALTILVGLTGCLFSFVVPRFGKTQVGNVAKFR